MSLAELFYRKHPRPRQVARPKTRTKARTHDPRRVLFERLEPRILLSSDPVLLPTPVIEPNTTVTEPAPVVSPTEPAPPSASTTTAAVTAPDDATAATTPVAPPAPATTTATATASGGFVDPPIDDNQKQAILDGVQGLADLADLLETFDALAQEIPVLGDDIHNSVGEVLGLANIVQTRIADPVAAYFAADTTPTTDELVAHLDTNVAEMTSIVGGLIGSEYRFDVVFHKDVAVAGVALDLGSQAAALGLSVNDPTATVDVDAALDLDFSFGVDLTPGLATAEAFFVRVNSFTASASVDATIPTVDGRIGFLEIEIGDGSLGSTIALDASVEVTLNDPDGDGSVTLTEITGTTLGNLVDLTPSGTLAVNLPVSAAVGDAGEAPSFEASGTVQIDDADIFAGPAPAVTLTGFDELSNFNNLSPGAILGVFEQLGGALQGIAANLNVEIPFVSEAIDQVADFTAMLTDLRDSLLDSGGNLAFESLQGLMEQLDDFLTDLTAGQLDLEYDPVGDTITFELQFDRTFAESIGLDFDTGIGPLQVSGDVEATFSVEATVDLRFGIDIGDLIPNPGTIVGTADAPSNGQITGPDDAVFDLTLGGSPAVTVTVAQSDTTDNDDIDDLVGDVNDALSAAGLGAFVVAGRSGNVLTLSTTTPTTLSISANASDPAVTQLGLPETNSADPDTLLQRLFVVEGSGISASASISTPTDAIDVSAALGIVGVSIVDGELSFTVGTSFTLTDGDGTAGEAITLSDLVADPTAFLPSAPTLTVGGSATLPLVFSGVTGIDPIDITISLTNSGGTLAVDVATNADFDELVASFTEFSFETVAAALNQLIAFIQGADFPFFDQTIPILNRSLDDILGFVSDLTSLADDLGAGVTTAAIDAVITNLDAAITALLPQVDEATDEAILEIRDAIQTAVTQLETAAADEVHALVSRLVSIKRELADFIDSLPGSVDTTALEAVRDALDAAVPSLDRIASLIEDALGLSDPSTVALSFADNRLVFDLHLEVSESASLDFGDLSADFGVGFGLVSFTASSGPITFEAGATMDLDFGLDFSGGPVPEVVVFDTTQFALEAEIVATGIELTLSVLGVQATLGTPGEIKFRNSGDTDAASIALTINPAVDPDPGTDGDAIPIGDLEFGISADALFTMEFGIHVGSESTATNLLVTFDPTNGDFDIDVPDDLLATLIGGALNFETFLAGIETFLDLLSDALTSDALGALPIIGDDLNDAGQFIEDIRAEFQDLVDQIPGFADIEDGIESFLLAQLGDGGLDLLDPTYFDSDTDGDGDPTTNPDTVADADDVDVTVSPTEAEVQFRLRGSEAITPSFDLGLSGFGLGISTTGGVELGFDWSVDFGARVDTTSGFAFLLNTDDSDPEVELELTVGLADGTTLEADLFFLHVELTDNTDDPDFDPTGLTGSLSINFSDPDDKLTIPEIPSAGVEVLVSASATINLDIVVSIDDNPAFPSLSTNLLVNWEFSNDAIGLEAAPIVAIRDISLNLGEFLSDAIGPMLDFFNDFLKPIRPIIELMNTEIPVISELSQLVGGDPVTFITLIEIFGDGGDTIATVFEVLTNLISFIDVLSAFDGDIIVNFGDFDFGSTDLRSTDLGTQTDILSLGAHATDPSFTGGSGSVPGDTDGLFSGLDNDDETSGGLGGLSFPLLDNPAQIVNLLFGKPVDLVLWDIPRLEAGFEYSQLFGPIIPPFPIFARITGAFDIFADFALGLDTRGIQTGNFLNGFFLADDQDQDGDDDPELGVSAEISAGAELNIVVASAGVRGGLEANITADWHDPNPDGKVYLDEVLENASRGIDCIFDLAGALKAFFEAFIKIGFDTPFGFVTLFSESIRLVDVTLFDFSASCPPLPPPVLAHVSDGAGADDTFGATTLDAGTLVLHVGPKAGLRQPGHSEDGAETLSVRFIATEDINGDGILTADEDIHKNDVIDLNMHEVKGFGEVQYYFGVTQIYGDAGVEDDVIKLDPSVTVNATLLGGSGEDQLTGGSGHDSMEGGSADDQLVGNAGNDTMKGDGGADVIFGNAGADTLFGGTEDDEIYGGDNNGKDVGDLGDEIHGGGGSDKVRGNAGNDTVFGDEGAEAGNDQVYGDAGNDTLWGGALMDQIEGGAGGDEIHGGDENEADPVNFGDLIFGGFKNAPSAALAAQDGNDDIFGDGGADIINDDYGNDTVHAGTGPDTVTTGRGADLIFGEAGNDVVEAGIDDDDIFGGDNNDLLFGREGHDSVEGGSGNDTLWGGIGNDTLIGGSALDGAADGADLLFGEAGLDSMAGDNATFGSVTLHTGGNGNDTLFGGADEDLMYGQGGNDSLEGSTADDTMYGGLGNDTLRGQENDDSMEGGAGNDTMFGGSGDDDMIGGAGVVLLGGILVAAGGPGLEGGSDGADFIVGDDQDDVIVADNGSIAAGSRDVVTVADGGAGSDIVFGGVGSDTIFGGGFGDLLTGDSDTGSGADLVVGDQGTKSSTLIVALHSDVVDSGGDDTISGSGGNDTLLGGDGNDSIDGAGDVDVLVGDNGVVMLAAGVVVRIQTTAGNGGNDTITGGNHADVALGGDGDDTITGGADDADDILIGDNGVVVRNDGSAEANDIFTTDPTFGGEDTITGGGGDDTIVGGSGGIVGVDDLSDADCVGGGDLLFGNTGNDVVIGDNAYITRNASDVITLIETTFPDHGGNDVAFGGDGNDTVLGGDGADSLSGGLNDDVLLGDNGRLDYLILDGNPATLDVIETTFPAEGCEDDIFGDDGDDFLVGGTDDDIMDGGAGRDIMLGDHGEILLGFGTSPLYRQLNTDGLLYKADGTANVTADFQPDPTGAPGFRINLFDFGELAGQEATFGNDIMAGGPGDDVMFGQIGVDFMQGDGSTVVLLPFEAATDGDDYMEGNSDADVMFGNLGQDDMIGGSSSLFGLDDILQRPDAGELIFGGAGTHATRNDPGDLAGVDEADQHARDADVIAGDNADIFRIVGATGQLLTFNYDVYTGPSGLKIIPRAINLLDYTPGAGSSTDQGAADEIHGEASDDSVHGATGNDVLYGEAHDDDLYGEVGHDWISGGTGEDGILGDDGKLMTSRNGTAEPLYGVAATTEESLSTPGGTLEATLNPTGELKKSVDLEPFDLGGDDTLYGGLGDDSVHGGQGNDAMSGAEALAAFYDDPASTPVLVFDPVTGDFVGLVGFDDGNPLVKITDHPLNFDASELDGDDALFGDLGNDWLVGGRGSDHMYGGLGNDILNADDNLETSEVETDAAFAEADTAFGGGGRDTLLGNTGADRLIDWVGEFNAYYVPFAPFGDHTVTRQILPQFPEFLYALAASDGSDQTRVGPGLGTAARRGEPFGELGLVLQQDADWHAQTDGPADPQAGNSPGKKKD